MRIGTGKKSHALTRSYPFDVFRTEREHLIKARPDTFVFAAIGGSAEQWRHYELALARELFIPRVSADIIKAFSNWLEKVVRR